MTVATRRQERQDTAANWTSVNPVLAQAELGWESDTGKLKIGDGSTAWNSLVYFTPPLLLGFTSYNPATRAIVTVTSSTSTDVDATNMKLVFVAPISGAVLVRLSSNASGATGGMTWNLRDSNGDVAGTQHAIARTSSVLRLNLPIRVTGLTPGTTYTWKWGQASIDNAASVSTRYGGSGSTLEGAAVMEAWAA